MLISLVQLAIISLTIFKINENNRLTNEITDKLINNPRIYSRSNLSRVKFIEPTNLLENNTASADVNSDFETNEFVWASGLRPL